MPRRKRREIKRKVKAATNYLDTIISKMKEFGISASDLSKKYGRKKPFTSLMLADLFEQRRPALEKIQITNSRGRYAHQKRPLKEQELLIAFVEKIAEEMKKIKKSKAGMISEQLRKSASNEVLKF